MEKEKIEKNETSKTVETDKTVEILLKEKFNITTDKLNSEIHKRLKKLPNKSLIETSFILSKGDLETFYVLQTFGMIIFHNKRLK